MSDQSVEERVIRVFADFKKVPPEEIAMDTTFDQIGFDSLDGLNLVFELEEEFDLTIPDNLVADMRGVRQAVEGIEALLAAKAQGVDVNAAAIDEFKKQQAEVEPGNAGQSGTAGTPDADPAS
ncbi:MAG TPA: acyl carrier protein [Pyrinomonadaceae bacterium]|nr:acyl carrier protein [Pyrinomonadaceae bacterium]